MRREVCTHTPCPHAHFSDTFSLRGVQTSRTRMAQGVYTTHVKSLHLTLSILMFHSPSLLFPDDHFETTFPTLTSAPSLPTCSRSESAGQAHYPVDPVNKEYRDPNTVDLRAPRFARYLQTAWKKHQNTVYCVDIKLAQQKGFKSYQTRSKRNHPLRHTPRLLYSEGYHDGNWRNHFEKVYASPQPPPKILRQLDERIGFRSCWRW